MARRSVMAYTVRLSRRAIQNGAENMASPIRMNGTPNSGKKLRKPLDIASSPLAWRVPANAVAVQKIAKAVHGMANSTDPIAGPVK